MWGMTQVHDVRPARWTPDDGNLGARLALIRQAFGWNIAEAARECGVNPDSWRLWEEGRKPRDLVEVTKKISERTGCDVDYLIWGPSRAQLEARVAVTQRYLDQPAAPKIPDVMTLIPTQRQPAPISTYRTPLPNVMTLPSVPRTPRRTYPVG